MKYSTFSAQEEAEDSKDIPSNLQALWKQTNYLQVGKKLSHDEMNER